MSIITWSIKTLNGAFYHALNLASLSVRVTLVSLSIFSLIRFTFQISVSVSRSESASEAADCSISYADCIIRVVFSSFFGIRNLNFMSETGAPRGRRGNCATQTEKLKINKRIHQINWECRERVAQSTEKSHLFPDNVTRAINAPIQRQIDGSVGLRDWLNRVCISYKYNKLIVTIFNWIDSKLSHSTVKPVFNTPMRFFNSFNFDFNFGLDLFDSISIAGKQKSASTLSYNVEWKLVQLREIHVAYLAEKLSAYT